MSEPLLAIQSNTAWQSIFNEEYITFPMGTPNRIALPTIAIPFLLESHVIAVSVMSDTAKPNWRYAGTLSYNFQLGTGGAASPLPIAYEQDEWLRINKARFFHFPHYTDYYFLEFKPVYWLTHLHLRVWGYVGSIGDTTELKLDELEVKADELEVKVDEILSIVSSPP